MHLYLGTYTDQIYRCQLDEHSGKLSEARPAGQANRASFLAVHPNGSFLYAALEAGDGGAVAAYAIDPETRDLTRLNDQPAEGDGTCYVSVDPSGTVVLAANYSSGSVAAFSINADGLLIPAAFSDQHEGSGPHPDRQKQPHAHCFIPTPSGRYALSCDLGTDKVYVYRITSNAGVEPHDPAFFELAPGSGPRHLAFSAAGRHVYVIGELANTITAFAWDPETGTADEIETVDTLPKGFSGENTTAEIAVHPSGRFVYGSNRGHDSIAVFARDADSGALTPRGHAGTRGSGPRHFALTPDGRFLVVANQKSDNVVVFDVCEETGELTPRGGEIKVEKPVCVRFAP